MRAQPKNPAHHSDRSGALFRSSPSSSLCLSLDLVWPVPRSAPAISPYTVVHSKMFYSVVWEMASNFRWYMRTCHSVEIMRERERERNSSRLVNKGVLLQDSVIVVFTWWPYILICCITEICNIRESYFRKVESWSMTVDVPTTQHYAPCSFLGENKCVYKILKNNI